MPEGPLYPASGVLADRKGDKKRRIKLSLAERDKLERRKLCEAASALFLDLAKSRSYKEIAEELGLSVYQLRELVRTEEFNDAYNNLFPDVGHDPRYKAVKSAVADMLPTAVHVAKEMLENPRTPAATRWGIAKTLLDSSNVLQGGQQNERTDMVNFLLQQNISIGNVVLPPEYLAQAADEVVDAEFRSSSEPQTSS